MDGGGAPRAPLFSLLDYFLEGGARRGVFSDHALFLNNFFEKILRFKQQKNPRMGGVYEEKTEIEKTCHLAERLFFVDGA